MKFLIIGLLAVFTNHSFADNTVLDFNSLVHFDDEYAYHDMLYSENGYTLDANNTLGFASWGTLNSNYADSPSLINDAGIGLTTLRKNDNSLFNLHSIDLAGLLIFFTNVQVTFTGTKADHSLITQTFTGPVALTTYTFTDFNNLSKVEWLQDNISLKLHQFDNINLSTANVTLVPEPEMAWLFGSALIGFAGLRRQKLI
ncbi:MAG: PEP-CTERM sorting domain-containing protein [Pseudomonadota bacterium]